MASIKCAHCTRTHTSVAEVADCANMEAEAKWEYEQERAAERFYEEGTPAQQDQYRWEVEQDERNAAMWGGRIYEGFDGTMQAHPPIWR